MRDGRAEPSMGSKARRGIWEFNLIALGKTLKGFLAVSGTIRFSFLKGHSGC